MLLSATVFDGLAGITRAFLAGDAGDRGLEGAVDSRDLRLGLAGSALGL
jgi:hypothetical protein